MKKLLFCALICSLSVSAFAGCGSNADEKETAVVVSGESIESEQSVSVEETTEETNQAVAESISDEQALAAIQKYCYSLNPDLEDIVSEGEYGVYWEIASSEENEIVVLYRSFTGAQARYYIDRATGDTYVTEFVPGIMEEEERTEETLNVKDYID